MKILPLATFALTLLVASVPLVPAVQASTGIERCEASDGSTVYTDTPCSVLGAASRPLPGDVLNRIAREEARNTPAAAHPDPLAPATVAVARRSASNGCARTPTQLAMDLRGSIALRDVNRLAESYHWVGMSQKQSQPIMLRLERLASQPLADTRYFDALIGPGGMQLADAGPGNARIGVMQLRFGGQSIQVLDFEVTRYAGCYFVKF